MSVAVGPIEGVPLPGARRAPAVVPIAVRLLLAEEMARASRTPSGMAMRLASRMRNAMVIRPVLRM
jgi:hypothetical protein